MHMILGTTVQEITFRLATLSDSNTFQKPFRQLITVLISLRLVNGGMSDVKHWGFSFTMHHGHPMPPPSRSMGNALISGYGSILPN